MVKRPSPSKSKRASGALSRMMGEGRSFSGNERNCCFLNMGAAPAAEGRFANISAVSGLDYPDDGRAVALVDWDHDGHLDMWISNRNAPRLRLMRNEVPRGNHFLALRLEGKGITTSRDAIGARLEVVLGGARVQRPESKASESTESGPRHTQIASGHPPLIKTLRAGEGFLAQSSKWLHFGLGAADVIDKVTVHWPGGDTEQFTGIDVDHRYRLIQGSGTARDITLPARETKLVRSTQKVLPPSQVARIRMVELLTVPKSRYVGFDGRQRDLPTKTGRLLLVNLWASWCGPCLAELSEFSQRYDEVRAKGIEILALSVDGLDGDASARAKAARLASDRKFPFTVGLATPQLTTDFQELHNFHIQLQGQLPLPSSFLIDRQGRLAVIYKGPVSIDELLEDVAHSDGNRLERFARSAPIAGQPIRHPQVERTAVNSAVFLRYLLAEYLRQSGRADQAARQYADVLKFRPDSFMAHNNLGNVLQGQGKIVEAIEHYHRALRINPDFAGAHNNLGNVLRGQGKIVEAIEHYHRALRIEPDDAGAHTNLGNALQGQGKIVEAIEHYHRALRINPDEAMTHNSLGSAVRVQGDIPAAVRHYTRALDLNPHLPHALNYLAWIRATHADTVLRDGKQAVELAERCCELTGYRVAAALDTLAAAYAEAGRSGAAIKAALKAIDAATAEGNEQLAQQIRGRAVLYRQGVPYREPSE